MCWIEQQQTFLRMWSKFNDYGPHISHFIFQREREIDRKTDGKKQKERSKRIREGKRENTQKGTLRPSYRHEE